MPDAINDFKTAEQVAQELVNDGVVPERLQHLVEHKLLLYMEGLAKFWRRSEAKAPHKDYEILKVKGGINGIHYYLVVALDFNKNWEIFSVKRLSDGEVFTIGDEIIAKCDSFIIGNKGGEPVKIEYIKESGCSLFLSGYNINICTKLKPVLFITEDGVEIHEGIKYSAVQKGTFDLLNNCIYPFPDDWLAFSTKEAAHDYIILNKQCLSLIDIIDKIHPYLAYPNAATKDLKELIKSKINA